MVKMEVKRRRCSVGALQGYGGEVGLLQRQDVKWDFEGGSLDLRAVPMGNVPGGEVSWGAHSQAEGLGLQDWG